MRIENDLSASFQQLRNDSVYLGLSLVLFGLLILSVGYVTGALLAGTPFDDLVTLITAGVLLPITLLFVLLADAGSDEA